MPGSVVAGRHAFGLACQYQQKQAGHNTDDGDSGDIYRPKITCEVAHFLSFDCSSSVLLKRQPGCFLEISRISAGVSTHNDANKRDEANHRGQRTKGVDIEFHTKYLPFT